MLMASVASPDSDTPGASPIYDREHMVVGL